MSQVSPETLALIVELLPTIGSLRDLCGVTGLPLETIRRETAPFLTIMKLQGTHPQCGCGRDRFHPYGCTDSFAKGIREGMVPGRTAEQSADVLAKRATIVAMLVAGERFVDINTALELPNKAARAYLRHLTPAQLAARAAAIDARGPIAPKPRAKKHKAKGAKAARGHVEPERPFRDSLYAQIAPAVPRWLSPALREDVISEMYVAICEGTLDRIDIEARAKRFASAAQAQFESKYGPVSIDMPRWEIGGATIGDCIPDPAALSAFDYIFEKAA